MNSNTFLTSFFICLIAGLSTVLGSLFIFIKPKNINKFISICLSFSAIIMILISIFDLIPNSFFYLLKKYNIIGFIISIIVFLVGILLIKITTKITSNLEEKGSSLYKLGIISAIVLMLHNIPEGIITFLSGISDLNVGIKIAVAIMLHNIPEGICIAVPLYYSTYSVFKAVKGSLVSGLSEPFGAVLAYLFLYRFINNTILNLILIFVAGIMISLSINEILKESIKYSQNNNKYIYIGFILGIFFFLISLFIYLVFYSNTLFYFFKKSRGLNF